MSPGQFILQQGFSKELKQFPYIKEFVLTKSNSIQLDSFRQSTCENLRIYCMIDGKFEWVINQDIHVLYPGDTVVVLPGQNIGGSNEYLDIGAFFELQLKMEQISKEGFLSLGEWSSLSASECSTIGKILFFSNVQVIKVKQASSILQEMHIELTNQEIGHVTRINNLIDYLLIVLARQTTQQASSRRDFSQVFLKLEEQLRQRLSYQWTVEEMSAMVGLGTTAFTEKVKSYTGFPPLHYLINIRISEATKLLKQQEINITVIALKTGFYSSQHFSTTFKKLTGHTPSEFRKKHISNQKH